VIEYGLLVEIINDDAEPPTLTYKFFGPDGTSEIIFSQEAAVSSQGFDGKKTVKYYRPLEEEAARVQVMNMLFKDGGWQFKCTEPRGVVTVNASHEPYSRPYKVFLTFERELSSDD